MGATIMVAQVKPVKADSISVPSPSYFMRTMEKVFGTFPVNLDDSHIEKLSVLAATYDDDSFGNPWKELIKKIETLGTINVFSEY